MLDYYTHFVNIWFNKYFQDVVWNTTTHNLIKSIGV